jgi:hypothetical protein
LSWWWKVSSEQGYDFLEVQLDGVLQPGRISGEVDWRLEALHIPPGVHVVRWRYAKDGADTAGEDAGWLDEVRFEPPVAFRFETVPGGGSIQGGYRFRLLGADGAAFVVEDSGDLVDWSPLRTNSISGGHSELEIPVGTNTHRFFRARAHP